MLGFAARHVTFYWSWRRYSKTQARRLFASARCVRPAAVARASSTPASSRMRTGGNQFLLARIHHRTKPLQGPGAEQRQIARLCKHHFIDCFESIDAQDGVTDGARDGLAIGHEKGNIFFRHLNAELD